MKKVVSKNSLKKRSVVVEWIFSIVLLYSFAASLWLLLAFVATILDMQFDHPVIDFLKLTLVPSLLLTIGGFSVTAVFDALHQRLEKQLYPKKHSLEAHLATLQKTLENAARLIKSA